ncbi:MAG TPA: trypsin-like peptidase domain-containing protein [Isosphaeraceae bacterium]|nr:trypsin-like peptidase domain-containing protein [Isosphaeraceae bacterium]
MSRTTSPLVPVAMLAAGVALGLGLDRVLTAPRAARAVAAPAGAGDDAPSAPPRGPQGRGDEDEIYRQLAKQYDRFEPVNRTFELVSRAVSPAVVHIVAKKASRHNDGSLSKFDETGSGVIVRGAPGRTLYVLTNHHVVVGAATKDIHIRLLDGRVIHPDRIWSDTKADIAVLKLGRDDLPAARLGNSDDLAVGTWVLALGSPFGLTHSVSQGIISARGRHEKELEDEGVENQDFLQTDAAINPGNSGGPLVNLKGEVVGINTAIATSHNGSEGVGFSIPINLARWIMDQLVARGRVSRGAMGVDLDDLRPDTASALGLANPRGAQILEVHRDSPADRAGLHNLDVVLRFNGVEVVDLNHLINLVSMAPIGQPAEVVIWRDRKEHVHSVVVADRDRVLAQAPPEPMARSPRPGSSPSAVSSTATAHALGLELVTIDAAATARQLGLPDSWRGVAIVVVEPDSPLAGACRPLDVITSLNGRTVRGADEVARALGRPAGQATLEVALQRLVAGARQRLTVRVP